MTAVVVYVYGGSFDLVRELKRGAEGENEFSSGCTELRGTFSHQVEVPNSPYIRVGVQLKRHNLTGSDLIIHRPV